MQVLIDGNNCRWNSELQFAASQANMVEPTYTKHIESGGVPVILHRITKVPSVAWQLLKGNQLHQHEFMVWYNWHHQNSVAYMSLAM